MGETTTRALTQLLSFVVDNRGRTCPTAESGFPLIATNCLKRGSREPVFEKVRYVDARTYSTWFRAHPVPGDVLFVCKGSPGRVALVADPVTYCIAQDMVALRPDHSRVDSRYLYYRLMADDVQASIENMHVGTMIPHFKRGDFGKLQFTVHDDLAEQRAIAEVLGALDDKIAANDRLVAGCDALATLEWKRSAVNGPTVQLSSLASFVNGRAFTKDARGSGRVVIRIAELNSGIGGSTVYNDIDVADVHVAKPGDLLFAWSGSLTVARWFRPEAIVNQHIFKVIPTPANSTWLVNQAIRAKLEDYRATAADKATTMGHIQRRHLDEHVQIPSSDEIERIAAIMAVLWDRALAAEIERLQLARTRDELLPLLMSGKLRVKDAEAVVSDVV